MTLRLMAGRGMAARPLVAGDGADDEAGLCVGSDGVGRGTMGDTATALVAMDPLSRRL